VLAAAAQIGQWLPGGAAVPKSARAPALAG
jgi:hypothetical protein